MAVPRPRPGLPLRRGVFWIHLTTGLTAGLVILSMSATGVALTYEDQVVGWAERHLRRTPAPDESRLPLPTLAATSLAAAAPGARVTSLVLASDPSAPVEVRLSDRSSVLLDPYTGDVRGERAEGVRAVFAWITAFHRWFAFEGDARSVARAATGAANLAFLFLLLSGLWLWWPRRPNARAFRAIGVFRGGLRGRAREYNWHHVFGVWSALPLVVIVASGSVFYYGWANDLVDRLAGEGGSEPRSAAAPAPIAPASPPSLADVERLLPAATAYQEGWRTVTVSIPGSGDRVRFDLDAGTGAQPGRQGTLTMSATTGEAVEWAPFESLSPGRRVRLLLRYAHTGEIWGWPGQTVAGLASLAGVFLVWTGAVLGLRRLGVVGRARRAPEPDDPR